ncbi:MAG: type II secretion system protein [Planctomycetota bacterium]|nr:type II secretion system protein [Planctomycetota bacterium]
MRIASQQRIVHNAHNTQYAIRNTQKRAFSLVEVVTALIILSLICSSVLLVINRCMASAAESVLRMQALEVARENMENILSAGSIEELIEYGSSDKYPDIIWKTTVESFSEPVNSKMWIRAVCSADYTDTAGQTQTIELTHWVTDLTKEQTQQLLDQKEKDKLKSPIISTEQQAADYAGVDIETIRQWVANGLPITEMGYSKGQLDLFKRTDGNPTEDQIMRQTQVDELMQPQQPQTDQQTTPNQEDTSPEQGGQETLGVPENWDQMSSDEQMKWITEKVEAQ